MTSELSVWLESYRTPLKQAFAQAVHDGFGQCALSTLRPDFQPKDFSSSAQRHLLRHVRDLGLRLDGLTLALPDTGLANSARAEARLAHTFETLRLTRDLGLRNCHLATAGLDLEDPDPLVREALGQIVEVADGYGLRLALQPSGGTGREALKLVESLRCPSVGITLDTADLDLPRTNLSGHVAQVHVRDVRQVGGQVEEVPYGTGQVDFDRLLGTLATADFDGALTLRRDGQQVPPGALAEGAALLRERIAQRHLFE